MAHFLIVAVALIASAGCAEYDIEIICEKQINSYGVPPGQAGNLLDVTLVCLTDRDMRSLASGQGLPEWDKMEEQDLRSLITAEAWFDGGLRESMEPEIARDAIFKTTLTDGGHVKDEKLIHPSPGRGKACIVALADFSNRARAEDDNKQRVFQAEVLRLTAWRWSHRVKLRVGKTKIWWDHQ